MKIFLTIVTTTLLAGILVGLSTYYLVRQNFEAEKQQLEARIAVLENKTKSDSNSPDAIESMEKTKEDNQTRSQDFILAKQTVTNFLEAQKERDFEKAKPFMTEDLIGRYTQTTFAGVSSPSMGRSQISTAEYLESADLYQVKAKVYQNLNNEEVGYSENTYNLVKTGTKLLVNEIKESNFIETN